MNPEKRTRAFKLECVLDDLPTSTAGTIDITRISASDIPQKSTEILNAFTEKGYFLLTVDDAYQKELDELYSQMASFFRQSGKEKHRQCAGTPISGFFRGYERIHFPNLNNRREPEERDVIQLRGDFKDNVFPNDTFKEISSKMFLRLFDYSLGIFKAIATATNLPFEFLTKILTDKPEVSVDHCRETNFSLFRYQDDQKLLTKPQKCMVHQDAGLITLIPRSTTPGLQIFDPHEYKWIQIEDFSKPNEILVFCGLEFQKIFGGIIQAPTHRVIRGAALEKDPHLEDRERLSCPFELKGEGSKVIPSFYKYRQEHPEYEMPAIFKHYQTYRNLHANLERLLFEDEKHFHFAYCDKCRSPISSGTRYKCGDCNDFDLCEKCFDSSGQEWHQSFFANEELFNQEEEAEVIRKKAERRKIQSTKKHEFFKMEVNVPAPFSDEKDLCDVRVDSFVYQLNNWKHNKRSFQLGDLDHNLAFVSIDD